MKAIELHDVIKRYGRDPFVVHALAGIDLTIESGEFISIVGRSGSGKTTLLDVMGLLLPPTSGRVLLNGVDASTLHDSELAGLRSRKVGFVFQEYNLLPGLNVLENVMLPLRYARSGRPGGHSRAIELTARVGLQDRVGHRPDQLSGGQQQRVAIARALVNRPAIVLADEATGAVDTQTAAGLVSLMRQLNREEGATFVLVTHDHEIAAATDRIVELGGGRVISDQCVRRPPPEPRMDQQVPALAETA